MYDLLYKAGVIEVMKDEIAVARIFPQTNMYLVKILSDGYDFSCESIDTALTTIKLKVGR